MTKQEFIVRLSILINRPVKEVAETNFFTNVKHDDLIELLRKYLVANQKYLGPLSIEPTQSLNDHGVDLIVRMGDKIKIGFQIKSHFDIQSDDFQLKVKSQLTESLFHDLDKWYLLICSPIQDKNKNYSAKISHLLNELSSYTTTYHGVIGPLNLVDVFKNPSVFPEDQFLMWNRLFLYQKIDKSKIEEEFKSHIESDSFSEKLHAVKEYSINHTTCNGFVKYLRENGFLEEEKEIIRNIDDLFDKLHKLTPQMRDFLYVICELSVIGNNLYPCSNCAYVSLLEIKDRIGMGRAAVSERVKGLERYKLAYWDEEDVAIYKAFTLGQQLDDLCLLYELREYLKQKGGNLKNLIVDMNFTQLD